MTSIKVVGTSSSGNGYLIESGDQILIVECGLPLNAFLMALDYNRGLKKVVGGVISHRHSDHLNRSAVNNFHKRGIQFYSHNDVCEFEPSILPLKFNKKNKIGGFYVQMFETHHDVPNVGYLIETPSGERILFITDTNKISYCFNDIHCIMIECNHDDDVMVDNLMENEFYMSKPENHLSLEDCILFCKNNLSANLQKILLIHMSNYNLDPKKAVYVMREELSFFDVECARDNQTYYIEQSEF